MPEMFPLVRDQITCKSNCNRQRCTCELDGGDRNPSSQLRRNHKLMAHTLLHGTAFYARSSEAHLKWPFGIPLPSLLLRSLMLCLAILGHREILPDLPALFRFHQNTFVPSLLPLALSQYVLPPP